jgi:hypothetical protein
MRVNTSRRKTKHKSLSFWGTILDHTVSDSLHEQEEERIKQINGYKRGEQHPPPTENVANEERQELLVKVRNNLFLFFRDSGFIPVGQLSTQ